jgi:hypothetical protein
MIDTYAGKVLYLTTLIYNHWVANGQHHAKNVN